MAGGTHAGFQTRWFVRFAKSEHISDASLAAAVARAERGLLDADLGGGIVKQRVARPGKGKSGGYRTVIAYRARNRVVFLFGFAKSERDNVSDEQLAALKNAAGDISRRSDNNIAEDIAAGRLQEVDYDDQD
jgi:hypothetical protein